VIAHRFALHVPGGLTEALALMATHGLDAAALAGGTVLLPDMGRGAIRPAVVVDVTRAVRSGMRRQDGSTVLSGTTTYQQLEREPGLLGLFARRITGGPQIRNRATVGGSAACANPASDAPPVLAALRARLVLASAGGERRVRAEQFFVDAFRTAIAAGELLVAVEIPEAPAGTRFGYQKLTFGESSWPVVTAAAAVRADGGVRLAVGGAAAIPFVVEVPRRDDVDEAVAAALVEPWADVLATGAYRRRVAPVIARRAVENALADDASATPARPR
jgi:CO/xanthine dehydrogenase FAD-binding subunit